MSGPVVLVEGADVWLGGRHVLDHVGFAIGPGELTGLIGSNGAGKTTLLRVILGLQPAGGRVEVGGRPVGRSARSQVGYVPQKVPIDADVPLRARDLVALGLDGNRYGLRRPSRRRDEAVEEMLAAVGATALADARVGTLSGGEQQRVLIAHALIAQPPLLLLDEPLANLDLANGQEVVALLSRLSKEEGVAVLLSAHDMNPLLPVMDRLVYVAEGRVASGTPSEVVRGDVLSALYGHPVSVLEVGGRVVVVAGDAGSGDLVHR
jgi:zinc/manganese transport system ATP-binding protein